MSGGRQGHVVMLASENDALKGGKVGGIGDVLRDLPRALAGQGWMATVIIPSYGFLHKENPSKIIAKVSFPYGGSDTTGEIWEASGKDPSDGVRLLLLEHSGVRGTPIYFNDPPEHAFAQDATKYALFCSAVGQYLKEMDEPYVLHLHDWHTPFILLLRDLHPAFVHLKNVPTAFTIHNLAIQGTRPIRGKYASVEKWFPELFSHDDWIKGWKDPRYTEPSFTPMAAGIRFTHRVNTVSPTYAKEILLPSDKHNGHFRGEGLDEYLNAADREGRLFGILNGCEYPPDRRPAKIGFDALCDLMASEIGRWNSAKPSALYAALLSRVEVLRSRRCELVLTSVTRVVEQKVKLYFERASDGRRAIDEILDLLERTNGVYLFLGTGTPDYEKLLEDTFRSHERFVFLRGYSDHLASALYGSGTIFMMPSSFEPCGISQMIAMRDGQPCIVNAVGGLRDTVKDGVDGFQFSGSTLKEQADNLVRVTARAIDLWRTDRARWGEISAAAARARFTWDGSAKKYIELLYS